MPEIVESDRFQQWPIFAILDVRLGDSFVSSFDDLLEIPLV